MWGGCAVEKLCRGLHYAMGSFYLLQAFPKPEKHASTCNALATLAGDGAGAGAGVVEKLYRAALDKFEAVLDEEPGGVPCVHTARCVKCPAGMGRLHVEGSWGVVWCSFPIV